jgi:hypothetical protein
MIDPVIESDRSPRTALILEALAAWKIISAGVGIGSWQDLTDLEVVADGPRPRAS